MALRRLGLSDELMDRFSASGLLSASDVLKRTEIELRNILDLSHEEVLRVQRIIGAAVAPAPLTVLRMREQALRLFFIPTGAGARLDESLRGGLQCGAITEACSLLRGRSPVVAGRAGARAQVCGASGAGKTQLLLQVALMAALPAALGGLGGGACFVDTEDAFAPDRLVEMARAREGRHFAEQARLAELASAITVFKAGAPAPPAPSPSRPPPRTQVASCAELDRLLGGLERLLIERRVRLLVIDSIAGLFRKEYGQGALAQRGAALMATAGRLKRARRRRAGASRGRRLTGALQAPRRAPLPRRRRLQPALPGPLSRPSGGGRGRGRAGGAGGGAVPGGGGAEGQAALGLAWAHSVSTRLVLEGAPGGPAPGEGLLHVAKSAHCAPAALPFRLGPAGLLVL
eukprot:tig00000808_g4402.t1